MKVQQWVSIYVSILSLSLAEFLLHAVQLLLFLFYLLSQVSIFIL